MTLKSCLKRSIAYLRIRRMPRFVSIARMSFLPLFNPDPNYSSFPPSQHLPALSPQLLADQAQVAKLLAARSSQLADLPSSNLHQDTGELIHRASAAHALSRKILGMAEGTQNEGYAKFIETAAGRAEAASRMLAHSQKAKTLATPPHEIDWYRPIKMAGIDNLLIFSCRRYSSFLY